MAGQTPNTDQFEAYFQRADVDRDGRISGNEAVAFLQASNLPRQVLAQIWMYADQNRVGFLGRSEFYNFLKLVTVAQSKRELTPDLVKAALYGPASAQIPPPQINLAAAVGPQSNAKAGPSPVQLAGPPASTEGNGDGSLTQQRQITRAPRPLPPSSGFQSQPGVSAQGMPSTGSMSISRLPNSFDSFGGITDGSQARLSSQVPNRSLIPSATQGDISHVPSPITQPKVPEITGLSQSASSKPNDTVLVRSQVGKEVSNSLSATGNVISATPSKPQNNPAAFTYPAVSVTASSTGSFASSSKPSAVSQPSAIQAQQFQSTSRANQHVPAPKSSAFPVVAGQSQSPWPKMTQSDVQKYRKVFVQVDTDRDGKITGEQARNLFLSWRLPREVLKQVWDLSDQDNDSMLSLGEFCIALYLMERYREGRPLPNALPNSIMFDETLLPTSAPPAPPAGFQQTQGAKNARSITSAGIGRPPRPVPAPQPDEPIQQKAKVPVLEKHLLDQLSSEEQDSLNRKFEEAKDAEKKVADLEKDISEAKQKIQFFHVKMQELILYKSRCDNRLNEISERVIADKREAESLANKYEEKYKQVGDVASKLTIEEATFRDIQEKKMEVYRAIIKLEQDNTDGVQDRANQIQSDLEELVKALNERCKTYGLRGKPTSLVELPFGMQPGIEAAAADWDEVWDKFEDEGFTYVKELTLEVQNVIAPPKPKSALIREHVSSLDNSGTVKSPSKADDTSELPSSGERVHENERINTHNPEQTARSPPDSPAGNKTVVSPPKEIQDLRLRDFNINGSPHAFDTQKSEFGAESVLSGEKRFDEPHWGSFDTHYDTVASWDIKSYNIVNQEAEHERHSEGSLFGPDDWGLNPIRTGSKVSDPTIPKQGPFFDSVPSTPQYNSASTPHIDNLFARTSPFAFADSVPSTPMYNSNNSPRRFSEGSEEQQHSFDSFSRFDSFNMHDSGPLSARESLTRFDSMRSTRDSTDFDQGYYGQRESLTRFDSFRSTADSDYNFGQAPPHDSFTRFDSMRSTRDSDYGQGFPSFDDAADPFGSSEPFRTSQEAQTPRKDSDNWKAF
ncbi:uncharacterized calcium-binding protein c800.10c [Phtheirospermum japonicum]|uniref:Uncharacterized calcium-binding protein c800.10c n=1 Tax=Phtheirospermum japonicum TaxID=374723 RepID=A0A830DFQ5_9LAMI|nr:uncharacterized calcium-binding protein c800.10c [Phtheirospermum japonicum]